MLEYLRNAADKPVAKALMFVLIFSFVGWGAAEWIFGGSSSDTSLVHVGSADVSLQQFNNEKSIQLASMSKEEQRASYTDPKKAAELTNSVISKLTTNQLALNRAKDLGFYVSDKRIAEEIRKDPQFQVKGQFQPWFFDMILQNSGVSEKDVINSLRGRVLSSMALGAVNVSLPVPQFAVDAAYNARYTKRDIKYLTVKFSDYKVAEPTEEQLKVYYSSHPTVIPETRSVSYVFFAADNSKPDEYDAGYKKMQEIEDMIISGEGMKAAADKGNAKYVSVAKITRGSKVSDKVLTDDLIAKLFSMESGSESELIELKDGFVILRVDEIVAEHNAEYKDVKSSLVDGWKKTEQRKKAYEKANEKLIALNKGENVKDLKSASVSRTEGAPLAVLNIAFAGKVGDNAIAEDGGAFYVLNIGKDTMPASDKAKKESLRKELEKMSTRFVQDDYTRFLKHEYPVKINERNYEKFIAK